MIRILIADDSTLTRAVLRDIIITDPQLQIVAEVDNGRKAVTETARLRPDLVIMDVMMPVLDGLDATVEIMAETPTPILILSANVDHQANRNAFQAIRLGALDVLEKPKGLGTAAFEAIARKLLERIHILSHIRVVHHYRRERKLPSAQPAPSPPPPELPAGSRNLLAIGASTGGPKAIMQLLQQLPLCQASVLIVQHIANGFAEGFADWLGHDSPWAVRVASEGDSLEPGRVLVAPCGQHLTVAGNRIRLTDQPPVNSCRPAIDELFRSLARNGLARQTVALLLTGMGHDGAAGMQELKRAGATCYAQDEKSSVIYGMPKAALDLGAVDGMLPLLDMPPLLAKILPR